MEKIYFLSGLGTEADSIRDLKNELVEKGYELLYLDLPGQHTNRDVLIDNEEDLLRWMRANIPEDSIVAAYSLGADLLLKFSNRIRPSMIIVLDGAMLGRDFMNLTLEQEQEQVRTHIERNNLEMNVDTVQQLLKIRGADDKNVFSRKVDANILLLLSDHPKEVYEYKCLVIERESAQSPNTIEVRFVAETTHDFYTEQPKEIAERMAEFIETVVISSEDF